MYTEKIERRSPKGAKLFIGVVEPMTQQFFEEFQYLGFLFNENNSYLMFQIISKILKI